MDSVSTTEKHDERGCPTSNTGCLIIAIRPVSYIKCGNSFPSASSEGALNGMCDICALHMYATMEL